MFEINGLIVTRESVADFKRDHEPFLEKHKADVGYFKQDTPGLSWPFYFALEEKGAIRLWCLRNPDKQLIGYAVYFVTDNIHWVNIKDATCDLIYVAAEHRGGTGAKWISWIDEQLKAEGIHSVKHHIKVYFEWGSILKRMDYAHIENIYIKRLN